MKAEIVSIGTELLLGEINDTNATYLSQKLRDIGVDLLYRTTVGDNEQRIADVIRQALVRSDIVITTGGLGPTVDDKTREAIAAATRHPLEFKPELLEQISARFRLFGVTMSDNNKQQAYVPEGALPIENPVGTAPVFILETVNGAVLVLPGVPREMKHIFENVYVPWLIEHLGEQTVIKSLTLRTAGIGESQIDHRIGDLMKLTNPTVGLAAHTGQTDIRITAKAPDEAAARALIKPVEDEIYSRLGKWIYGTGQISIEEAVTDLLVDGSSTIACTESGTGDLLYSRLSDVFGNHDIALIQGDTGWASGDDEMPEKYLESLEEITRELLAKSSSGYALGVVIKQEAAGGKAFYAVANKSKATGRKYEWKEDRPDANVWITTHAIAMLWRLIVEERAPG